MKPISCLMLILLSIMTITQTPTMASEWEPWETPSQPGSTKKSQNTALGMSIKLFQKYISPVDGSRCSMYPTCSSYALQAIEHYGPLLGTFIFVDRLYHEGDPHEHHQPIIKHGYIRHHDPLSNNTFWLNSR